MQPIELQDVRSGEIHTIPDAICILRPEFARDAAIRAAIPTPRTYLAAVPRDLQCIIRDHFPERRVKIADYAAAAQRDFDKYAQRTPHLITGAMHIVYNYAELQRDFPELAGHPMILPAYCNVKIAHGKFYGVVPRVDPTDPYSIMEHHLKVDLIQLPGFYLRFGAIMPCGLVHMYAHSKTRVGMDSVFLADIVQQRIVRIPNDAAYMQCLDDYGCTQRITPLLRVSTHLSVEFATATLQ